MKPTPKLLAVGKSESLLAQTPGSFATTRND